MLGRALLLLSGSLLSAGAGEGAGAQGLETVSVVLTTICRNEAVNFRSNLGLWLPVVEYFVFLVDERTKDDSEDVIRATLEGRALGYRILPHKFQTFGQARSASLAAAWEHFPQASHVLVADPDWRPRVETLDKAHLVYNTQVFRFNVQDRNGLTTRNMDWLLRQRPGLRMRYALHEVLDIGPYNFTHTGWRVEEVELPGTWHASQGHGHSMSLKRYAFDLDMLGRDLPVYGLRDPHINYYLGVTHWAYATELEQVLQNATGRLNVFPSSVSAEAEELEHHLRLALGNATARALGSYAEEFLEQRWGAMFIAAAVRARRSSTLYDPASSLFWAQTCLDFGPGQTECLRSALVFAFKSLGDLALATELAQTLVRVKVVPRVMQNTRHEDECVTPALASVVLGEALVRSYPSSTSVSTSTSAPAAAAQYALHLRAMAQEPQCQSSQALLAATTSLGLGVGAGATASAAAARQEALLLSILDAASVPAHSSIADACTDAALARYIAAEKIETYACKSVREAVAHARRCVDFATPLPPPSEELQAAVFGEMIGAASILDVAHHVYRGRLGRLSPSSSSPSSSPSSPRGAWRVLLAEHFNPRLLYSLLGQADRLLGGHIDVAVVTSRQAEAEAIRATLQACGEPEQRGGRNVSIFVSPSLSDFFASNPGLAPFDYIEFFGGANRAVGSQPSVDADLALLRRALVPDGVLGLTFFSSNRHQEALDRLLLGRQTERLPPLSSKPEHSWRLYLDSQGLGGLRDDPALARFFAGDLQRPQHEGESHAATAAALAARRPLLQSEAEALLTAAGLEVVSWLPSAFGRPLHELPHYELKRLWVAGFSDDDVAHSLLPMFRYTVYAAPPPSDAANGPASAPGRSLVSALAGLGQGLGLDSAQELRRARAALARVVPVDRVGQLAVSLGDHHGRALSGANTLLHFTSLALPRGLGNVTLYVPAGVMPACALLSSAVSVTKMLDAGESFWAAFARDKGLPEGDCGDQPELSPALNAAQLLRVLDFLERVNAVSFLVLDPNPDPDQPQPQAQGETKEQDGGSGSGSDDKEREKERVLVQRAEGAAAAAAAALKAEVASLTGVLVSALSTAAASDQEQGKGKGQGFEQAVLALAKMVPLPAPALTPTTTLSPALSQGQGQGQGQGLCLGRLRWEERRLRYLASSPGLGGMERSRLVGSAGRVPALRRLRAWVVAALASTTLSSSSSCVGEEEADAADLALALGPHSASASASASASSPALAARQGGGGVRLAPGAMQALAQPRALSSLLAGDADFVVVDEALDAGAEAAVMLALARAEQWMPAGARAGAGVEEREGRVYHSSSLLLGQGATGAQGAVAAVASQLAAALSLPALSTQAQAQGQEKQIGQEKESGLLSVVELRVVAVDLLPLSSSSTSSSSSSASAGLQLQAGEGQIVAVLWLGADEGEEGEEGMILMGREGGATTTSSSLPRSRGRVVLLGPGLTFLFPSPSSLLSLSLPHGQEQEQEQEHGVGVPFEATTALALVVTMTLSR